MQTVLNTLAPAGYSTPQLHLKNSWLYVVTMPLKKHQHLFNEPTTYDPTVHSTMSGQSTKVAHPSHMDLSSPSSKQYRDIQGHLDFGRSILMQYFRSLISHPPPTNHVSRQAQSMANTSYSSNKWMILQMQHLISGAHSIPYLWFRWWRTRHANQTPRTCRTV